MTNKLDKVKYAEDFPDTGNFDWVTVQFTDKAPAHLSGGKLLGVLLHDDCFAINGCVFNPEEFTIIDYDPNEIHSFWKAKFDALSDDDVKYYIECTNRSARFRMIECIVLNTVKRNRGDRLCIKK